MINLLWKVGRQSEKLNVYKTLRLFKIYKLDCYLITYKKGLSIKCHSDIVDGHRHYRLNIQLIGKNRLYLFNNLRQSLGRIALFRADWPHSFGTTMENGLILSFGLAIKEK